MNPHIETLKDMLIMERRDSQFSNRSKVSKTAFESRISALTAAIADMERMEWLQSLMAHPNYLHDINIRWDHEDGIWLSRVDRGCCCCEQPIEWSGKQTTLRNAIDAAMKGGE